MPQTTLLTEPLSTPPAPGPVPWPETVSLLAEQQGVVMLIGAQDVGKTTLTLEAANSAVRAGRKAAILDTDLGQGEVGPPGTLGVLRLQEPAASLGHLRPRAFAFVGDVSPIGHLLTLVQGARKLVDHSLSRGDDVVYVDTSGLVHGRLAEKLKLAKVAVLDPSLVVVVQRGEEVERLARLIETSIPTRVVRVQSPPEVRKKSPVYRRSQRVNRMARHMTGARVHELDAGQVMVFDAWLYSGEAVTAAQLNLATEALGTRILHGEVTADGVYLCAEGRPERGGFVALHEEFGRRRITVTPATAFRHLLVGLIGAGGHLVDVGLLQAVHFDRAALSILTPARSVADVRQVHFGRLRLRPDGSEIARLRPSDL